MNAYQEITLLPSADINLNFLWGKVYQKIHLRLVETKTPDGLSPIGLAFPDYNAETCQLGAKLRVFAEDKETLEHFNAKKCLHNLSDYIHITGIRDVPTNVSNYVRFKRKQSKSSTERLARRKAKRESVDFEHAMQLLQNHKEALINAPFVHIFSASSGNVYKLFISKEHVTGQINKGFSCYGLSPDSTLPHF